MAISPLSIELSATSVAWTEFVPRSLAVSDSLVTLADATASAAMSGALTWPAPILFERTELLARSAVFTSPSTMSVEKTVLAA